MSGPAFTPGPWLIHSANRGIVPAADTFKTWAAALPICLLRDPDERLTEDETLANGFLIAASPELYEAAVEALAFVEEMEGKFDKHFLVGGELHRAICKARGEQ
jgi:hypothetical protein